jgi:tetratricopeptide (TPR) repeat protein
MEPANPRGWWRLLAAALGILLLCLAALDLFLWRRLGSLREEARQEGARDAAAVDPLLLLEGLAQLPDAALDRSPELLDTSTGLAARLASEGHREAVEKILRKAMERSPDSWHRHYAYGALLRDEGRFESGLEEFRRAAALAPREARIPLQIGLTYFALSRRRDAEAAFQESLALDPGLSDAYLGLAFMNNTRANYPRAAAYAQRFSSLRPRSGDGHAMLARMYLHLEQAAAAAAAARAAIRRQPDAGAAWHMLGMAQSLGGAQNEAARSFQRAVELEPELPDAHYELGRIYLQQGALAPAVGELRRATELRPGSGQHHWTLMQALRRSGDRAAADREAPLANRYLAYEREQKRLVQRIRDHPNEAAYYEQLARLHLQEQQPERALQVSRDGLAIAPDSAPLREMLQQARALAGKAGGD